MKKYLLLFVLLPLCGNLLGQEVFEANGICYRIITDADESSTYGTVSVCAKRYGKYMGEITIPNAVKQGTDAYADSYRVIGIDPEAFSECEDLISVTLPPSIESMGNSAFAYSGLQQITIPYGNLTVIPARAFDHSSLKAVVLPKSIVTLEENAFSNSRLESIKAEGIVTIGAGSFAWTPLKEVSLPLTLVSIGDYAFQHCTSLASISIPESVKSIGLYCFQDCEKLETVSLPSDLQELKATAFNNSGIRQITVPASIKVLESGVFSRCHNLQKVILPSELIRIADYVFSGCTSLTSIVIPEKVKNLGPGAFYGCWGLNHMYVSSTTPPIVGEDAFKDVPPLTLHVPSPAQSAYQNAETWKEMQIEAYDFSKGDPNMIEHKRTRINIQEYAKFEGTSFEVPDGIREIGDFAFYNSTKLETIVLPASLEKIAQGAFAGCAALREVILPSGMKEIGDQAFSGCDVLTSVIIPEGVTRISDYAFNKCRSLNNVVLPAGITEIGKNAFEETAVEQVVIPEGVKSIQDYAFNNCKSLKRIVLPSSLESIGYSAFEDCSTLQEVDIPASVTKIGRGAFANCSSLNKVVVRGLTTQWSNSTFSWCDNLREIEVHSDILQLNSDVFSKYAKYIKDVSASDKVISAVDLGLSVKWSEFNLGAESSMDKGNLYAWGETSPKEDFSKENYAFLSGNAYTKYCVEERYGTVDGSRSLSAKDDAAVVNLGEGWRMPTETEVQELISNCTWEYISNTVGNPGFKVTGPSGNSIFIPYDFGKVQFWTSTLGASSFGSTPYGRILEIEYNMSEVKTSVTNRTRYSGAMIRPVIK